MTIYVNGNVVTYMEALAHFVGQNFSCDIVELKMILDKGLQTDGEEQRDIMLDDGIEIILD